MSTNHDALPGIEEMLARTNASRNALALNYHSPAMEGFGRYCADLAVPWLIRRIRELEAEVALTRGNDPTVSTAEEEAFWERAEARLKERRSP